MTQGEEDGLRRLIETEGRIAEALATAHAEAAAVVASARDEAEADEHRYEQELARDMVALAAGIAAKRDGDILRIASEAETRSQRLRALPDTAVDELAAWVVSRMDVDTGRPP